MNVSGFSNQHSYNFQHTKQNHLTKQQEISEQNAHEAKLANLRLSRLVQKAKSLGINVDADVFKQLHKFAWSGQNEHSSEQIFLKKLQIEQRKIQDEQQIKQTSHQLDIVA